MFDIIRKAEYFQCLNEGFASETDRSLKGIQDGWTALQLTGISGRRIMEVGGGHSRILPKLSGNKLWNADKFEGVGQGPTAAQQSETIEIVDTFMGDFSPDAPQVDVIFSISVIEHIPFEGYAASFADMARCLAPGGIMYHTVDLPLNDAPLAHSDMRIRLLKEAVEKAGLKWQDAPVLDVGQVFESDMASNSDIATWSWTRICDMTKLTGPLNQLVSIKIIATKN